MVDDDCEVCSEASIILFSLLCDPSSLSSSSSISERNRLISPIMACNVCSINSGYVSLSSLQLSPWMDWHLVVGGGGIDILPSLLFLKHPPLLATSLDDGEDDDGEDDSDKLEGITKSRAKIIKVHLVSSSLHVSCIVISSSMVSGSDAVAAKRVGSCIHS